MAKDPLQKEALQTVMYCLLEAQRLVHLALYPFMPQTATKALVALGCPSEPEGVAMTWGRLPVGTRIDKAPALFPRIENKD